MKNPRTILGKEIIRWPDILSPLSMFFCFLFSFFSFSWLLWLRLLRPWIPRYFADLNIYLVSYFCFLFLLLLLSFLYLKGFFPWKVQGTFILWLKEKPWGNFLYHGWKKFANLLAHSFYYVFMFCWEKIPTEKTLFLWKPSLFLWPHMEFLPFSYQLLYFLLSPFPKILVASIFLGEAYFQDGFYYFYSFIFLLFIPWFAKAYLYFWEAWAVGWIKNLEAYEVSVEEKEGDEIFLSPLWPMSPSQFSIISSLWDRAAQVKDAFDLIFSFKRKWDSYTLIFLFLLYFLGWLTILLRFFILS